MNGSVMVQSIDFMCSNTPVPAAAGAMLVVSENGDIYILSPKIAPDTAMPATRPGLISMP